MRSDDSGNDDKSRMTTSHEPTSQERRAAVCAAMGRAPSMVRYAARYTSSIDDAEDVYQRAMEIALTKAPTVEADAFLAWLYTVIKNEALAVRRGRYREPLGRRDDIAAAETPADDASSPEQVAEWRERHRGVRDALDSLSQQQRTCVMLQSTGLTYEQISRVTGFSRRQIERSIARGRRRLSVWEDKLASGAACEQLRPTLERILQGEATERERRRAAKHTAACGPCRASLMRSQSMRQTLAGLVPVSVLASIDYQPLATDPGGAFDLGERVALGAASRLTQIAGPLAELPLTGIGRVGAGVGAVAIAFLAFVPFLGSSSPAAPPAPTEPVPLIAHGPAAPPMTVRATTSTTPKATKAVARAAVKTRPRRRTRIPRAPRAAPAPPGTSVPMTVVAPKRSVGYAGSSSAEFGP